MRNPKVEKRILDILQERGAVGAKELSALVLNGDTDGGMFAASVQVLKDKNKITYTTLHEGGGGLALTLARGTYSPFGAWLSEYRSDLIATGAAMLSLLALLRS